MFADSFLYLGQVHAAFLLESSLLSVLMSVAFQVDSVDESTVSAGSWTAGLAGPGGVGISFGIPFQ